MSLEQKKNRRSRAFTTTSVLSSFRSSTSFSKKKEKETKNENSENKILTKARSEFSASTPVNKKEELSNSNSKRKYLLTNRNFIFNDVQMLAIADFEAVGPQDLQLNIGDVIYFLEKDENGWLRGATEDLRIGWFPATKVKFLSKKNPFEVEWHCDREDVEAKLNEFLKTRPSKADLQERKILMSENSSMNKLIQRKNKLSLFFQKNSDKTSIFGSSLSSLVSDPTQPLIPTIVTQSINYLREKEAHKLEGIFRISGTIEETIRLREEYANLNSEAMLAGISPHTVATLLKQFFMSLIDPVIPFASYNSYVSLLDKDIPEDEKILEYKKLLEQLPMVNRATLHFLLEYLVVINSNSVENLMTSSNLGVVFGPSLLRSQVPDPISLMSSTSSRVIEYMIDNFSALFN